MSGPESHPGAFDPPGPSSKRRNALRVFLQVFGAISVFTCFGGLVSTGFAGSTPGMIVSVLWAIPATICLGWAGRLNNNV